MLSIGDLARSLTMRTYQAQAKSNVQRYSQEVTTGLTGDAARALDGNIAPIAQIQSELTLLDAFRRSATEASLSADAMQTVLTDIQTVTASLGADFLKVDLASSADVRAALSASAGHAFSTVVDRLNAGQAGLTLFAGTATDSAALADDTTIMNALRAAVSGAVTATDVTTQIDAWFDTPGGGFETSGYMGATAGRQPYLLNDAETVSLDLRADHAVFRDLLRYTAMAALATDPGLGFGSAMQTSLMQTAANGLLTAQTNLTGLQADIGAAQQRIGDASQRNDARHAALTMSLSDILSVDPYDAATRLEQSQTQLETIYAVTARQTRLRLVDFLR
ncbi:MAG: hypothetical protein KDK26_11960 [Roseivivax sp.]|nr:hypothetical protein [Roseivivax sp.]